MDQENIKNLLKRYVQDACSDEEKALLESWYLQREPLVSIEEEHLQQDLQEVGSRLPLYTSPRRKNIFIGVFRQPAIAAAAAILIILSISLLFYFNSKTTGDTEIVPGGNKALLTLSNGQKISLTDASDGNIANQANVRITKTANGQLIYTMLKSDDSSLPPTYNTVETPYGGQFHIILPDGTKVWLNAASSLRFPTYFAGKERKVELTGEGYFEVSPNKKMPFIVATQNQETEVLGTHFNINAYKDEGVIKTTLVEGSIKVKTPLGTEILKPGQQSALDANNLQVYEVDTDIAVAWKNGQFMFNDERIEAIMRQISRWYNVDIAFVGKPSGDKVFWGTISRFEDVHQVLEILEMTKAVKFKIEGRRIVVMR